MNRSFLSSRYLNLLIVEFDTEDNMVRTNKTIWEHNIDLDNIPNFLSEYGLWRYENKRMWFKSKSNVSTIRLNNFNLKHKIKKINKRHFEIYCPNLFTWFDQHDNIEIIVKK